MDPCGLGKEHTCNVTIGSMWFRKRTHMQMTPVDQCGSGENRHAMNLLDQCGLGKEHTCNDTSGSMWFTKRTHMKMSLVDQCRSAKEHTCKCHY